MTQVNDQLEDHSKWWVGSDQALAFLFSWGVYEHFWEMVKKEEVASRYKKYQGKGYFLSAAKI